MTFHPRRFDPREVEDASGPLTPDEAVALGLVARDLEAIAASSEAVGPTSDFSARVMAAVALEPAIHGASLLGPVRARPGLRGVVESVRSAWALALSSARPARARAMAVAYVLAIAVIGVSFTGGAAYGAASAFGLLGPRATDQPFVPASIAPSDSPKSLESPEPSPEPSATESAEPTDSAEPSETPGETTSETGGGGSGSGGGAPTPRATSESQDRASPSPSSSDEHGGSSESPSPSTSGESH